MTKKLQIASILIPVLCLWPHTRSARGAGIVALPVVGPAPARTAVMSVRGKPPLLPQMLLVDLVPLRPLRWIYGPPDGILAAVLPAQGGLLLAGAVQPAPGQGRPFGTEIRQFSPQSGEQVLTRRYPWEVSSGGHVSEGQYPFKAGPDGMLWCVSYSPQQPRPTVRAVDWGTGRVVAKASVPAGFGICSIFPVRGAAVLVAASDRPGLYVVCEDGRSFPAKLSAKLSGVPYFMVASGRTLSGITARGGRLVVLKVTVKGRIRVLLEHALAGLSGQAVIAYRRTGRGRGVVLARGRSPTQRRLYFVSTRSGTVLDRETVHFAAQTLAVFRGQVYLIGVGGSVALVGAAGRIISEIPPALRFDKALGP